MGSVAARLADFTVVTTDNPRKERPETIAAQILNGFSAEKIDLCAVELDRKRAIRKIIAMAREGDSVLLAGKGHETYQEFSDTVVPFDDRLMAREALQDLGFQGGCE